jgi:hypothetical protein
MQPLARLKYLTQEVWPAQYPGLPFIWNRELDPYIADPARLANLRWIICSDNPGVEEAKSGRFLAPTGRSGKEARKAIAQAGLNWEQQVIVLNKSILHTPKTVDLKALPAGPVRATEVALAQVILELLAQTSANLWIVGFGGCDPKEPGWPRKLLGKDRYPASYITPHFYAALRDGGAPFQDRIVISKHFSHGQFAIEMKQFPPDWSLATKLAALPHAKHLFEPSP